MSTSSGDAEPSKDVVWTREQQENTIAGLNVVREVLAGDVRNGPLDATEEVRKAVEEFREENDADALARLVAGLVNLSAMLIEHIYPDVKPEVPTSADSDEIFTLPDYARWLDSVERTIKDIRLSD